MSNVMDGIRILEVAEHTFVPAASGILADWGAEVIKIEHVTRGDAARGLGSTGIAGFSGKVAVLMEHANRGKKSLGLDLTQDEGREILYQLAGISDVFLTNKMAGVRSKLKIDPEDIRAHNPNIVYVRGTGYGNRGPDTDAGGYDSLGFWARGTVAYAATPSDLPQPINQPGPAFGDSIGAMTIAGGISAALLHRERTGEAKIVDISLLSTAMWAMGGTIAVSQDIDMAWQAPPAGEPAAPFNPLIGYFGTSDGRFIMFSMLQGFHYWPEVCERLKVTELITDPRFDSHEKLMENAAVGADLIRAEIAKYTLAEIKDILTGMRGQWAIVQDTMEIADDPQVIANGYLPELEYDGYKYRLVSTPVQFDEQASTPGKSPDFNEHGDQILTELLGLDWDSVIDLKVKGVVA
jgi:crotonobetainyl-CoA:carnitine CoA-transferase CaiB-like acyl-CoA transferase